MNAALVAVRDGAWAIGRDRLRTARAVAALAGPGAGPAAIEAMTSVQAALSALDRLEVRGRDSAGLTLLVRDHGLDLDGPGMAAVLADRGADPAFGSGAVRAADGCLSFVYKAAAEIGELGDNTATLRAGDRRRRAAAPGPGRTDAPRSWCWATPGGPASASSPRPTPTRSTARRTAATGGPYVTAALNGDVDNFADLKASGRAAHTPPRSPPTPRSSPRW